MPNSQLSKEQWAELSTAVDNLVNDLRSRNEAHSARMGYPPLPEGQYESLRAELTRKLRRYYRPTTSCLASA